MKHQEIVIIVDFGGQYVQLIARAVCANAAYTAKSCRTTSQPVRFWSPT